MHKVKKILVLPGDGIGKEVCEAALPVFACFNLPIELIYGDIGWEFWQKLGNPIPEETWQKIDQADAVLLGAITSKAKAQAEQELPSHLQGKKHPYISPVIQLRQKLDLFANVRPAFYIHGSYKPFDFCIIRENSEGLYAGYDFQGIPQAIQSIVNHPNIFAHGYNEASCTIRLQTKFGLERIFTFAFEYAIRNNQRRVTFADKPNVMRESGEFASKLFFNIAAGFPGIRADIQNVDAVALWLVTRPHQFGVIVAENMFGDILSDVAAGVMGGLGLAPSANIGLKKAYFEPVHGSAPIIAGKNKANPSAMFLSIGLLLDYLGFSKEAQEVKEAVETVIKKSEHLTYDLGGEATTKKMSEAIISAVGEVKHIPQATIVTIGDELLSGRFQNTNQTDISQVLDKNGYRVREHIVCSDRIDDISKSIVRALGEKEIIIVSGGLGPTSDDVTRQAVAKALDLPLEHNEFCWDHVRQRMKSFNLPLASIDSVQALIPKGAEIIPNPNGTACGFKIQVMGTLIIVLPGPPKEMNPMLRNIFSQELKNEPSIIWKLMGVLESEICVAVNEILVHSNVKAKYVWRYPYLEVSIQNEDNRPCPPKILGSLHKLFLPNCVSNKGISASELVSEKPKVFWTSQDAHLNNILQQLPNKEGGQKFEVNTSPNITDIMKDLNFQGTLEITCTVNKNNMYNINIPLRGIEVIDYIKEFSCWCYLRYQNKNN